MPEGQRCSRKVRRDGRRIVHIAIRRRGPHYTQFTRANSTAAIQYSYWRHEAGYPQLFRFLYAAGCREEFAREAERRFYAQYPQPTPNR